MTESQEYDILPISLSLGKSPAANGENTIISLNDLEIPVYTTRKSHVKQKHTCDYNLKGVMEVNSQCVLFSLLEEICLVVSLNAEDGTYSLANKDGKVIGCAGDKFQLGSYKEM